MEIIGMLLAVIGFGVAIERVNFLMDDTSYGPAAQSAILYVILGVLAGIIGLCMYFWALSERRHRLADYRVLHGIHLRWQRVDGPITAILAGRLGVAEPTPEQLQEVDASWPEPVLRELNDRATLSLNLLGEWRVLLKNEGTRAAIETLDEIVVQRRAVQSAVRSALGV